MRFSALAGTAFIVCLLALSAPIHAQASPVAAFSQDTYNFGEVREGTVLEHSFTLKNAGDQTLSITRLVPG
jgi:hypothetical protein